MTVPFYDDMEATPIDGLTCLVEVERIYCLDWDHFGEDDWRELSRLYEALPGALRFRDGPMWFGDDEDMPPFLWASAEPPGLQVYGVLPEADWWAWDERFRSEAEGLPAGSGNRRPASPNALEGTPRGRSTSPAP